MSGPLPAAAVFAVLAVAWALLFVGVPANPSKEGEDVARIATWLVTLLTMWSIGFVLVDSLS